MSNKPKITDPTRILTVANMISLGRALMAVPIVYTLRDPAMGTITFLVVVLAVLSDTLDGWFARKANEVTHFGKWLDPIADFACIITVVGYLTLVGRFPGWFFIFYLLRYVAIALPAIYLFNNGHFILSSNWWGKWAAGITALAVMVHIWPWHAFPWMQEVTINIATMLLCISWFVYIRTFIQKIKAI